MKRRLNEIACVFRIHLARLRVEAGPFLLAAIAFPAGMYLFAAAIGDVGSTGIADSDHQLRFLSASVVFSLSLTAISWLGYLLLENRFTGRLKLFATLPLAPSSYVLGILIFALAQAAIGTSSLLVVARVLGVRTGLMTPVGLLVLAALVVLAMLAVCGVAVIVAARARSFSEGSLLTDALGAGLVLLAPIYYPPEATPMALRVFAGMLPTTYAARGVQVTLAGGTHVARELLVLVLMAAVTLTVAFRVMRLSEE
jgi:ABC-type multidrug transport system permease subunit